MLLGLDLGTTNVKAIVVDGSGCPVGRGACPVRLFHLENGGIEQDIDEIWQATLRAMTQALSACRPAEIQAIGVSSQAGALQLFDSDRRPIGRVISWLDQRGRQFDDALTAELGREWFWKSIAHGRSELAVGQLLRIRSEVPAQIEPNNRVGFVGDAVVARLCGCAAHDGTSAALTLLYNPRSRDYEPTLLKRLGITADQLPALLPPEQTAGGLLSSVAQQTGMRAGIPVSPAVHDQYAAALATGAVRPGLVMVATGTVWVLLGVTEQIPGPVNQYALVCHHLVNDLWGQIFSMANGGSAFSWARNVTGTTGLDPKGIDELLESAGPGSGGLVFWPFLAPFTPAGLPVGIHGRLSGLQLSHQVAHIIRAVAEGLAFELNRHLEVLRSHGQPIVQLVLCGGGAASHVTSQILADVTGVPLRCFADSEASLVGAAILARGLIEPKAFLKELAETAPTPGFELQPGKDSAFYREQYYHYLTSLSS